MRVTRAPCRWLHGDRVLQDCQCFPLLRTWHLQKPTWLSTSCRSKSARLGGGLGRPVCSKNKEVLAEVIVRLETYSHNYSMFQRHRDVYKPPICMVETCGAGQGCCALAQTHIPLTFAVIASTRTSVVALLWCAPFGWPDVGLCVDIHGGDQEQRVLRGGGGRSKLGSQRYSGRSMLLCEGCNPTPRFRSFAQENPVPEGRCPRGKNIPGRMQRWNRSMGLR